MTRLEIVTEHAQRPVRLFAFFNPRPEKRGWPISHFIVPNGVQPFATKLHPDRVGPSALGMVSRSTS